MQRDVKIGLVLGVLLVAVVAVVFFRRDDAERDKFAKLLPGPEAVANRARDALGRSPTDPYPVSPEYLRGPWQGPAAAPAGDAAAKVARANPPRTPAAEPAAQARPKAAAAPAPANNATPAAPEYRAPQQPSPHREKSGPVTSLTQPVPGGSAGVRTYTIKDYDTLSEIAAREMGQASSWPELYDANQKVLRDPDHLPVGQVIRIPDARAQLAASPAAAAAPAAAPAKRPAHTGRTYEVREGDTLTAIARECYHKESRALIRAIFEANRDQLISEHDLREGMILRLPD